jgi:hypothetical protein
MQYMEEVYENRKKIRQSLRNKVNDDADCLNVLVDELAERATNIQGQGLTLFLQTRKDFIFKVEELRSEYIALFGVER